MLVNGHPIHFTYEGDITEVSKWISKGQSILRMCMNTGIPSKRVKVTDSVEIQATWLNGVGRLHIKAGGCKPCTHGFVDLILPLQDTSGIINPVFLYTDSNNKLHREVRRFFPKQYLSAGASLGPWGGNETLAKTRSFLSLTPGMFTGEMRKVVQVLLGQGVSIPYLPYANKCHGIYTIADAKWIIEISSDKGVLAWPLPVCPAAKSSLDAGTKAIVDALGYYPIEKELESNKSSSAHIIHLLSADEVKSAYTGTFALFPECGWAFNPNGSQAQNVMISPRGFLYGTRYVIDIGGDIGEKKPTSATITIAETGLVYGNKIDHIKIPDYTNQNIVSFDWYSSFAPPSGVSAWDGPVYCYYDELGQSIVVRSHNGGFVGSEVSTFPGGLDHTPDWVGEWEQFSYTATEKPAPNVNIGPHSSRLVQKSGVGRRKITYYIKDQKDGSTIMGSEFGSKSVANSTITWLGAKDETYSGVVSVNQHRVVVIPLLDRQGLIIAESEQTDYGSYTKREGYLAYQYGEMQGLYYSAGGAGQFAVLETASTGTLLPKWTNFESYSETQVTPTDDVTKGPFFNAADYIPPPELWETVITAIDPGAGTVSSGMLYVADQKSSSLPINPDYTYNFTTFNDGSNNHFMEYVSDAFSTSNLVISKDMDSTEFAGLYISGMSGYALGSLVSNNLPRFFIGKP